MPAFQAFVNSRQIQANPDVQASDTGQVIRLSRETRHSYDFHSDQGTCEGDGPEGGGTWFPDASETVPVNGDTGDVSTIGVFTGNDEITPTYTLQVSSSKLPSRPTEAAG
jgi:hypothetical protein